MQEELKAFMKEAINSIQQYKNDIIKEISDTKYLHIVTLFI